jgi:hypothetical protein
LKVRSIEQGEGSSEDSHEYPQYPAGEDIWRCAAPDRYKNDFGQIGCEQWNQKNILKVGCFEFTLAKGGKNADNQCKD